MTWLTYVYLILELKKNDTVAMAPTKLGYYIKIIMWW